MLKLEGSFVERAKGEIAEDNGSNYRFDIDSYLKQANAIRNSENKREKSFFKLVKSRIAIESQFGKKFFEHCRHFFLYLIFKLIFVRNVH